VRAAAANAGLNGVTEAVQLLQCGASLSDPDPLMQVRGVSANELRLWRWAARGAMRVC
jgi:hypothetical protein